MKKILLVVGLLGLVALTAGGSTSRAERLAQAIASAEGYFVDGSRSQRNNNPGDLTLDLTGKGVGWDGPFVIYATAADGWEALVKQTTMMLEGTSTFYNPEMTIEEMARIYTATEPYAWASNVAAYLGVSAQTKIGDV